MPVRVQGSSARAPAAPTGGPGDSRCWMPACAGMTLLAAAAPGRPSPPRRRGSSLRALAAPTGESGALECWIPAFTGMTLLRKHETAPMG